MVLDKTADTLGVMESPSELLDCLVRFPEDRIRWARRVGELMEENEQDFVDQALPLICNGSLRLESENALLAPLIQKGYVIPVLQAVHASDRIRFREVLSTVNALEPRLHTRITKRLTELLSQDNLNCVEEVVCLFDSVIRMNGKANLASALPLLKDSKEPRLRARAAFLSASLPNGRNLLELYRNEPDPRVRASILKLLWLDDQPLARVAFEEGRRDVQPRVRAFGLLGLYRLGDPRALLGLAEMAESPQTLTRAVVRTAMELLHEPRFELLLSKLRKEFGDSPLKHEATSPAVRYGKHQIQVVAPLIERLPSSKLQIHLSARLENAEQLDPALRPLDVRAWVDGQPIMSYTLMRVTPARRLGLGVVLPLSLRAACEVTPGIRGLLDILTSMPGGELRSVGFYRSGQFMRQTETGLARADCSCPEADSAPLRLPVVSQDEFRFAADVNDALKEDNLAGEPGELVLAMLSRLRVLNPSVHIGVVLSQAVKGVPDPVVVESIRQGCLETGCAIHVIALGRVAPEVLAPWSGLSRDSGGFQSQRQTEEELRGVVDSWLLSIRESYCLEFEAPALASHLRLQVVHPVGIGEIEVPIESGLTPPGDPLSEQIAEIEVPAL